MVTKNKTTNMWVALNGNKWDANLFTKNQASNISVICKRLYLMDKVNLTLDEATQILEEKEVGFAKRAEVVAKEEAQKEVNECKLRIEASTDLLSQYTNYDELVRKLMYLNTFNKSHHDTFYTDALDIRNSFINVADGFTLEVAKSVKLNKKISTKQAQIIASEIIKFNTK